MWCSKEKKFADGDDGFNQNRNKLWFSSTYLLWSEDTSVLAVFSSDDWEWDYVNSVCACSVYICKGDMCGSTLYEYRYWWIPYCFPYLYSSVPALCMFIFASLSSLPPLHTACVLCMTLECDGNRWASCVVTAFVIWDQTEGARSTVGVCYLTITLLKPSHLHLEWMPYCQWGSIPLGQSPSQPLCLLLCSTQRVKQ